MSKLLVSFQPLQPLNVIGIFQAKDWVCMGQAIHDAALLLRNWPQYCRALSSDINIK